MRGSDLISRTLGTLTLALVVVACHRPMRPARSLGSKLAALGGRVAAIVAPVAANVDVTVTAKVPPPRRAAARDEPADPPPAATPRPRPAPVRASPPPEVHVDRAVAAHPTVFVLHGQTHAGRAVCQSFTTLDACSAECTAMLRANMFGKPAPEATKSCSCLEQDTGC